MTTINKQFDVSQVFSSPDIVQKISDIIGQSIEKTKQGLNSVIPVLTSTIIDKGSTQEGAAKLFDIVETHHFESTIGPDESNLSEGSDVINNIFGEDIRKVSSDLGKSTGLGAPNISKIFSLTVPVLMGTLGNLIKKEKLSVTDLMEILSRQRINASAAPSEYSSLVDRSHDIPWARIGLGIIILVVIWYLFWWISLFRIIQP